MKIDVHIRYEYNQEFHAIINMK